MEVTTKVKENEWRSFLDSFDGAGIFHTPEWKLFLEKTFGYEPHYLFSKDENERINGFLPLFHIKSKFTGNRICSVPFSHICGYIGSSDSEDNLIHEAINLYARLNANYLEVRNSVNLRDFQCENSFSTYMLDLCPDIRDVWQKLERKSARWAIRKSKTMGVQVESTRNLDDLREFYELNCITKKDIGVPCHPWKFFENMFLCLNENVSLYIAKYNNEIIGGGVFLYFNRDVLYGYGAANPDYLGLHPYNAFIWKSIEDSCVSGYRHFDFGRTSYDNEGLINFKKRWGTHETRLYYSYFPEASKSLIGNRDNLKYKCGNKFIKGVPMSIYTIVSDLVFESFG